MSSTFLTDAEVDALCAPLRQPAAQVRFLREAMHLTVTTKPNGRAVLVRSHAEAVLSGATPTVAPAAVESTAPAAPKPDVDGFMRVIQGGRARGPQKKVQPA